MVGGVAIQLLSSGDEPHNGLLGTRINGGTVFEALVANHFIEEFNRVLSFRLALLSDTEILNNAGLGTMPSNQQANQPPVNALPTPSNLTWKPDDTTKLASPEQGMAASNMLSMGRRACVIQVLECPATHLFAGFHRANSSSSIPTLTAKITPIHPHSNAYCFALHLLPYSRASRTA